MERLLKCDCLCRNYMHERPALYPRKYLLIQNLCIVSHAHYHSAPRAPQCLVRCGCHKLCMGHRAWMQSCDYKACNMRNIRHHYCVDLICNIPEGLEVYNPGICACADNNHLWPVLFCKVPRLLIVNPVVVLSYPIKYTIIMEPMISILYPCLSVSSLMAS